jgi:glucokinase
VLPDILADGGPAPTSLPTGDYPSADALIGAMAGAVAGLRGRYDNIAAVGCGVPGLVDFDNGHVNHITNVAGWGNVPLRDILASKTGLPVLVDNDANCMAYAEFRHGAARGLRNVVALTLGTGIGGGLIIDGRPYRGSSGAGAEMGHVVIDGDGPPCNGNCPNRGCVEALASGTALAREGRTAAEREPDSALGRARAAGREIDGPEIVACARAGDQVAIDLLALVGRRLGVALSGLANTFDPDVIVLGGGVMDAGELLLGPARAELRRRALTPQNEVPVRAAALGADAGMIGAAILARDEISSGAEVTH